RRDVVGVEGMAKPERVREHAEPRERRVAAGVVGEEAEAEHVEDEDRAAETGKPEPLGPCEGRPHVRCGIARAVMTRPRPRTTSALAAGRRRTALPPRSTRANALFAAIAARPRPLIVAARPRLKATIRTSP